MLEAAWWGFVGGAALLLGAALGLLVRVPTRVIGVVLGFGAGVLFSAAAFELTEQAYEAAGAAPAVVGLLAGSLTFFAGDWLVDEHGGDQRLSPMHGGLRRDAADAMAAGGPAAPTMVQAAAGSSALALVLGALLDGVPESAAIGISLLDGGGVGAAMVLAVFLANVPEALSATTGLRAAGRSPAWVLTLWGGVVVASVVAAVLGYALLGDASPATIAFIETFAAGAIITTIADTMVPEAVEHAGRVVGLVMVLGFVLAFLVGAMA